MNTFQGAYIRKEYTIHAERGYGDVFRGNLCRLCTCTTDFKDTTNRTQFN